MSSLAVIVVSFNTRDLLRDCLRSIFSSNLETHLPGSLELPGRLATLDVIVVDNASHDGSAEMVRTEFPQVLLLEPGENLGFTKANNLALQTLTQSTNQPINYFLLLNPDTQLPPDTLARMVDFMESTPSAGACGAHLRYGDGSFQHGAFRFPSLAQVIIDLFPVHRLPGGHRLLDSGLNGRYARSLWEQGEPFVVDFVLGAAIMVRGEAVAQCGGLDEGFFMYCEEMDWCLRLAEAGWPVYALPDAKVIHFEGQSSKQVRWESFVQLWRSRFRFYAKHPTRYGPVHDGALRLILKIWLRQRRRDAQRRFAAGEITGIQLDAELTAYAAVSDL